MLTEQEHQRDWRNYALKNLAFGTLSLLSATCWIFMGVIRLVTESAWITSSLEIFVGIFFICMALYQLDNAWPWVSEKIHNTD